MPFRLLPPQRVAVAVDVDPDRLTGRRGTRGQVLRILDQLAGTGVIVKFTSVLRACGYDLIDEAKYRGFEVFTDLKLVDIRNTLLKDAAFLNESPPRLLTVKVSGASLAALRDTRRALLPTIEVLGVLVLTELSDDDTHERFAGSVIEIMQRLTPLVRSAPLGGVVCAPAEVRMLRGLLPADMTINATNVRPQGVVVLGDDQNRERSGTIEGAILAGADRVILGRSILQAQNIRDATLRTVDEVGNALAKREAGSV